MNFSKTVRDRFVITSKTTLIKKKEKPNFYDFKENEKKIIDGIKENLDFMKKTASSMSALPSTDDNLIEVTPIPN